MAKLTQQHFRTKTIPASSFKALTLPNTPNDISNGIPSILAPIIVTSPMKYYLYVHLHLSFNHRHTYLEHTRQ